MGRRLQGANAARLVTHHSGKSTAQASMSEPTYISRGVLLRGKAAIQAQIASLLRARDVKSLAQVQELKAEIDKLWEKAK